MVVGRTLFFYFARRFAKTVIAFFLLTVVIIALATFLEFFDRAFQIDAAGVKVALLSLFRVPSTSEDALPFVVLYGSMAAFVVANRRLEVVVARAAGVSAWQFLLPACIVGLLFGAFATAVYNPFAAALLTQSNLLSAQTFGSDDKTPVELGDGPIWVRQSAGGVESIVGAEKSYDGGLGLSGVTAYVFDGDGKFRERIDAPRARFSPGEWRLEDATVTEPSSNPQLHAVYTLPTNLSPNEVKRAFLRLSSVSFWALPGLAAAARRAGVPADRYELQFNVLLSRPILLLAMVLIAANVSLRFSRSRNLGRMIIAGMAVGFMLYVVMRIARDLGSGGIMPPPLAAWLPAIVATLVGATVLLHLEDG